MTNLTVDELITRSDELTSEWVAILMIAAKRRKQCIIQYKYLDKPELTMRVIEPIKWERGRKGIHVLAYSPEDKSWRRFALKNVLSIAMTCYDFISKEEPRI